MPLFCRLLCGGGFGALFDLVHVSQCCLYLGSEELLNPLCSEPWTSYIVAALYGPDPCLFDGVAGSGMEVSDEVWDSFGDVSSRCISRVFVMLCDCCFVGIGIVVGFYPFTVLVDFLWCQLYRWLWFRRGVGFV